jgi:hypothetical protein
MDEVQLAHLIEEEGDDDDEDISDFDEEDGSNGGSSDDDLEDFDVQVSIHLPEQCVFLSMSSGTLLADWKYSRNSGPRFGILV